MTDFERACRDPNITDVEILLRIEDMRKGPMDPRDQILADQILKAFRAARGQANDRP